MPTAHSVKVWIEVDGIPLLEYKVVTEGRRTTCYIPSQADKKFSICFNDTGKPRLSLTGNVFLDGISAGGHLLRATDTSHMTIKGQARSVGYEAPFVFAAVRTTDEEEEACNNVQRLRDLGTIRVRIDWVYVLRQREWHPPSNDPQEFTQPIYERSKKGSAHCAKLGEMEIARPLLCFSVARWLSFEPAEYIFKYAPLDWLTAEGIVSRPVVPSPTPGPSKRSHESSTLTPEGSESETELLDPDEAEAYKRLKAKITQGSQNGPNKRRRIVKEERVVKQEPGPSTLPGRKTGLPLVIDLTGDD